MTETSDQLNRLVVHHALHGYAHGHRKLALSRPLSKPSLRTLLSLSDMSGPSMLTGFETYLTGYPLRSDGLYAFAKTWYAREMDRPGCVWTHTMLLDNANLSAFRNASDLVPHFQRPTKGEAYCGYERPLDIRVLAATVHARSLPTDNLASRILSRLYSEERPVFLLADDSTSFEDLICAIWGQQWPGLRCSFSFCTGAINSRSVDGKTLDLQVTPFGNARNAKRQTPDCTVVNDDSGNEITPSDAWVEFATKDLLSRHGLPLREFLWRYAPDRDATRLNFSHFARAFLSIQDYWSKTIPLECLVSRIANMFSDPFEARLLKSALFGEASTRTFLHELEENELLQVLAQTPHQKAFDSDTLRLRFRAKRYWKHDYRKARSLARRVAESRSGQLKEAITYGFAEGITVHELIPLITEEPELLAAFVTSNPTLATNAELWESPDSVQQLLASTLACNVPNNHEACSAIVHAQLTAFSGLVAGTMAEWMKSALVGSVLDWLDSTAARDSHGLASSWERVIARQPQEVAGWLNTHVEIKSSTVAILVQFLNPHARELHAIEPQVWIRFGQRAPAELHPRELTDAMAFVLVLALDSVSANGAELARVSFPIVYKAAKIRHLDDRVWKPLQQALQTSWSFDPCQALRNGLMERAAAVGWPTGLFLSCVEDTTILQTLLSRWFIPPPQRTYLRRVINDARNEPAFATAEQREVLVEYSARFDDDRW